MILEYFKNKHKLKVDAEDTGFNRGQKITDRKWSKKLKRITADYNKILFEKEIKIKKLNERVEDIESNLDEYTLLLSRFKYLAIKIDEENEIKLKQLTNDYQEAKLLSNEALTIFRKFRKKSPETVKKINEFKRENLQ